MAAKRSYPTSEVGAAVESTRLRWCRNGLEELPRVRGRGGSREERRPEEFASKVRGGDERSYPASQVRGGGWEEIPHAPKPKAKGSGGEEQPLD